jgi:hypothetical protein
MLAPSSYSYLRIQVKDPETGVWTNTDEVPIYKSARISPSEIPLAVWLTYAAYLEVSREGGPLRVVKVTTTSQVEVVGLDEDGC